MQKPLIVMALEEEGQGKPEELGFDVLYCGVGKVNAAYHLTRKLHQSRHSDIHYPYVLNFGSAGSHSYNTGTLVELHSYVQRDMDVTGLGFELGVTPFEDMLPTITFPCRFSKLPSGICGSGDSFLQGKSPLPSDVIDMEAYALAKICFYEKIPFCSVKYITDGADGNAAQNWQDNLHNAAQAFATLLHSELN